MKELAVGTNLSFFKRNKRVWVLLLIFILAGCKHKPVDNVSDAVVSGDMGEEQKRAFKMIEFPITVTSEEERSHFLMLHYWDNFDFKDTVYIHLPEVTEQAFVDFITLFPYIEKEIVDTGIKRHLQQAQEELLMFEYFREMYKKYLYDPNSPVRNEEYYIPVLEYLTVSDAVDKTEQERAKYRLELLMKNRVGDKANNITYTLKDGKAGTLHAINAPYTLLMFYNPDCHTCAETTQLLKASPVINQLVNNKILAILAFYPDEDLTIWEKHYRDIPDSWINGYDKQQLVEKNKIYDLKAIPTLYLLDSDKNVLLKDETAEVIERYLWNNNAINYKG